MKFGFVNVAALSPKIKVADCNFNAISAIEACEKACEQGAQIICLPELYLTGYTCGDLLLHSTLLAGAQKALLKFAKCTKELNALIFIGMPFMLNSKLYNCAFAVNCGKIIGAIPKSNLPNYSEFYEMRHFDTYTEQSNIKVNIEQHEFLFGTKLLFKTVDMKNLAIATEICEDLWVANSPSVSHAKAGANVIVNLSASNELVGKAEYRRNLVKMQSAKLFCAYIYSSASSFESTTDLVFAGHNIIAENGEVLSEAKLFENEAIHAQIDIQKLVNERVRTKQSSQNLSNEYSHVSFTLKENNAPFIRYYSKTPFIPQSKSKLNARCEEVLNLQAAGLSRRLLHINSKASVIGISGGLDSCLALLVCVRAHKMANLPLNNIVAVTMPGFGTTSKTKSNAQILCEELGVTFKEIDIKNTANSNLKDIEQAENIFDTTYENVQARVRTLILMNLANKLNGIVVGTGDLSELALGFATFNGDHISMYNVNCSVPKTLVRHLVAYCANQSEGKQFAQVLNDILATPVSPELLPPKDGEIAQKTESIIGPYELHDFFLYYFIRFSFSPAKICYLAKQAFKDDYNESDIIKYLKLFTTRFFSQQFKRNCVPDGPKIGSVSLSPRGDWRMPSDACASLWLSEIESL